MPQVLLDQRDPGALADQTHPATLFELSLAHFELFLTARQVHHVSQSPETLATPEMLSACAKMHRSAATRAAHLCSDGHDMGSFERICSSIELNLKHAASRRALYFLDTFQLPPDVLHSPSHLPHGVLPEPLQPPQSVAGLEAARRLQEENLGSQPLLHIHLDDELRPFTPFTQILEALKSPAWKNAKDSVTAQLALRSVEDELFRRANAGFGPDITSGLVESELTALQETVDLYRQLLHNFLLTKAGMASMRVELLSRELLVVWIAYCLTDASAVNHHPQIMGAFGVSLHFDDLRHLVLSDKQAVDAALSVGSYLKSRTITDSR